MKKRTNFFKSLRFRILIILIILGIVPSVIVTYTMLHNYQDRAVSMLTETVQDQSEILCNLIIKENYLNDTGSQTVNTKLEMFADLYNGRVLLADRDCKIVGDTFHTEEGTTLLSSLAVKGFKGEKASNVDLKSKVLEVEVPVQSPDVQQIQGVMLMTISTIEIGDMMAELEQKGMMLIGIIVVLSIFLSWLLSTILVKPLARVTKAIEDLTDGMQDDAISDPEQALVDYIKHIRLDKWELEYKLRVQELADAEKTGATDKMLKALQDLESLRSMKKEIENMGKGETLKQETRSKI